MEWYLSLQTGTRLFDEAGYDHAKRALCVREAKPHNTPPTGNAGPSSAEETQRRGYWVDPSTKLMWTATDNRQKFVPSEGIRYCKNLRLARYSDWRLPTIEELQGIYERSAESAGGALRNGHHDPLPLLFHVKGNLFLTGNQWSTTPTPNDSEGKSQGMWGFDFTSGNRFNESHENYFNRALCVRRSTE